MRRHALRCKKCKAASVINDAQEAFETNILVHSSAVLFPKKSKTLKHRDRASQICDALGTQKPASFSRSLP